MSKPRHAAGIVTSEVLDELVAYSPAPAQAVSMNQSARAIWELCDGTLTVEGICSELSELAGIPAGALREDVQTTIDKLTELGLLTAGNA
jgi:hypothetical protein